MTAPDRIWCHPTERQPVPAKDRRNAKWVRGGWKDHNSNAHGDVEYVRADLAAVQPAQVRVKPLGSDGVKIHPQDILNAAWRDDLGEEGRAMYNRILTALNPQPTPDALHRSFQDAGDGRPMPPMGDELMIAGLSVDDARFVAVQLAQNGLTLTAHPDPRDEVIARLVEAADECRQALKDYMKQYPHMVKGYLVDAEQHARAALAAAKAVQVKWDKIETAPRGGEWFIARTEHGTTRVVRFADEYDRFPISHDGVVWPTAPIEWTPLRPVLAALEPQPDPRDEVIARLVEALGFYADMTAWTQPPVKTREGLLTLEYENQASKMQKDRGAKARAALAAAKAVQHG